MKRALLLRIGSSLLSLALLVTLVFFMIYATPGGPAYSILGVHASPAAVAALNRQMGLDHPIWRQYLTWWDHVLQGDLGYSFTQHAPVASLIGSYLHNTLLLDAVAATAAIALAIVLGLLQGARSRGLGRAIGAWQIVGYSLPTFFVGTVLILVFAADLSWLPPGGLGEGAHSVWSASLWRHLALPAVTLALPLAAGLSRYFGHQVRDEYRKDYVRAARARGLGPVRIAFRHVLRNAVRPLVTLIGMMIPVLFVGGVLTESVFDYPGLGWLLWRSALEQDYPTLTAIVLLIGILTILGNLAADLINTLLDVRVRYD
ncbi:ABC transporter permease [Acidiferrobacter sp.]|uniref:ABC transporter permease n=1 Tax=Acidiferrobacter sp. TaxID=1872107 RepID=UPI00262F27D9|nr:ABC transporter permease [Acidiferrobacter sp.]